MVKKLSDTQKTAQRCGKPQSREQTSQHELRNARTDLALEKTASSGYRHENRELKRKLKALETPESEAFNFECVGVENANDYKVV